MRSRHAKQACNELRLQLWAASACSNSPAAPIAPLPPPVPPHRRPPYPPRRRPIDELIEACLTHVTAQFQHTLSQVHDLFARYGTDEACAMCLLACLQQNADPTLLGKLAQWAQGLGGAPTFEQGAQAVAAQGAAVKKEETIRHSGRHGGICRAVARLLVGRCRTRRITEAERNPDHEPKPKVEPETATRNR